MPESAEVKLTTEYLKSKLENKVITEWYFQSGQYENKSPDGFDEFEANLPLIVENVQCKGKFIYFTLFNEKGYFYIMHSLRMTGRWQDYEDKYCRWYVELDNKELLWFRNPRCFATLDFTPHRPKLQKYLDKLGPDILTEDFSLDVWKNLVNKHKNKNITSFLMNQNVISGIGNYIKAEALYYAKISPYRKTGSITDAESGRLFEGIRIIPRVAYKNNGLDYASSDESYGQDLKIYGKSGADRDKTPDGRVTYWDSEVQV
jgi:DNA-formamidopyrimidine glycosylase